MRLLIIGGVAAGTKAAARARREYPEAEVTIVTQDEYVAYAGCGLPYFVGGEISEAKELIVRTPDEFKQENGITVLTRHQALRIDPAAHEVLVRDLSYGMQRMFPYDKLIIATGAVPLLPQHRRHHPQARFHCARTDRCEKDPRACWTPASCATRWSSAAGSSGWRWRRIWRAAGWR